MRAHRTLLLPGQFISHTSAALLWGLPLPARISHETVHVTSQGQQNPMRRPGVQGHRSAPELAVVRQRWGMPTSSPATTWIECGSLLRLEDLVALGDAIVSSSTCRTSVEDLRRELDRRRGCRGGKRLRVALDLVRAGSGSPKETQLRLIIVRAGFPEPSLQVTIRNDRGQFVGRVDMAYPQHRLVIEYEGDRHRTDDRQWGKDIRRYRELDRLGWFVLRVTKRDLDEHLAETLEVLAERLGLRPGRVLP